MSEAKVIKLGLGEVVSNWGTHNGIPAVFIEPVLGAAGEVGQKVDREREPQIQDNSVSAGGVIIEIHDILGLHVLLENFASAIKSLAGGAE